MGAGRDVAEAKVEPHGVETGLEDDDVVPPLRDAALGETDEGCADALAYGRGRDVEAFDGVGCSMKPADNLQAERSNPNLILRNGLLDARNAAALCPGRRLALGKMCEGEVADRRLPDVKEGGDIRGIGEAEVQR